MIYFFYFHCIADKVIIDLNYIKSHKTFTAAVRKRSASDFLLLAVINKFRGVAEVTVLACFDLNKYTTPVSVHCDNIYLTEIQSEVSVFY